MSTKKNVSQNAIDKFIAACELIERDGISATAAQKIVGTSAGSFYDVLHSSDEHRERYARATAIAVDVAADEIVRLSSMADIDFSSAGTIPFAEIQRRKLHTDTLKWALSKRCPEKYGDRITHAGAADAPVVVKINGNDALV